MDDRRRHMRTKAVEDKGKQKGERVAVMLAAQLGGDRDSNYKPKKSMAYPWVYFSFVRSFVCLLACAGFIYAEFFPPRL